MSPPLHFCPSSTPRPDPWKVQSHTQSGLALAIPSPFKSLSSLSARPDLISPPRRSIGCSACPATRILCLPPHALAFSWKVRSRDPNPSLPGSLQARTQRHTFALDRPRQGVLAPLLHSMQSSLPILSHGQVLGFDSQSPLPPPWTPRPFNPFFSPAFLPATLLGGPGDSDAEQGGGRHFRSQELGEGEDGLLLTSPLGLVRLAYTMHHAAYTAYM